MIQHVDVPHILTPPPSLAPRINGAAVFGVRPGMPVLFKVPATGKRPLLYEVVNLSNGLEIDPATGILTGCLLRPGEYTLHVRVSNRIGKAERDLVIKVGNAISLTPPMGWNSWNAFGLTVTQDQIRAVAQTMIDQGLIDHGWSYVNIDDGWEAETRTQDGDLRGGKNFSDIKGLATWLHERGLKFGVYSSPGPTTCGGHLGSYKFEPQDARTFAEWGVDYLKYDLCSYQWEVFEKEGDQSEAAWVKPFLKMHKELDRQLRDVVYSICSFDSIPWAAKAGANLTRVTPDIRDTWDSILRSGFNVVDRFAENNGPGLWTDEDMLVVGNTSGGWENKVRPNRLTPDEQYSHFSLWCLLSAPLLIGCDLTVADRFTISLLSNDEVIEVDQDSLGKQAHRAVKTDGYQVLVKEMEDGSRVVGIFNMLEQSQKIGVKWSDLGISGGEVRDLWRQKGLGRYKEHFDTEVAAHGVILIRVSSQTQRKSKHHE